MVTHNAESGTPVMWRGIDHHGAGRTGFAIPDDLAAFVKERFDAGWKSLEVKSHGEVLGQIARNVDGQRIWWGETARPTPPVMSDDRPNGSSDHETHSPPESTP